MRTFERGVEDETSHVLWCSGSFMFLKFHKLCEKFDKN